MIPENQLIGLKSQPRTLPKHLQKSVVSIRLMFIIILGINCKFLCVLLKCLEIIYDFRWNYFKFQMFS